MRIKSRLASLEALVAAEGAIATRVHALSREERDKLKRQLEAQIHGELVGSRGPASYERREKRAFTLARIERENVAKAGEAGA